MANIYSIPQAATTSPDQIRRLYVERFQIVTEQICNLISQLDFRLYGSNDPNHLFPTEALNPLSERISVLNGLTTNKGNITTYQFFTLFRPIFEDFVICVMSQRAEQIDDQLFDPMFDLEEIIDIINLNKHKNKLSEIELKRLQNIDSFVGAINIAVNEKLGQILAKHKDGEVPTRPEDLEEIINRFQFPAEILKVADPIKLCDIVNLLVEQKLPLIRQNRLPEGEIATLLEQKKVFLTHYRFPSTIKAFNEAFQCFARKADCDNLYGRVHGEDDDIVIYFFKDMFPRLDKILQPDNREEYAAYLEQQQLDNTEIENVLAQDPFAGFDSVGAFADTNSGMEF